MGTASPRRRPPPSSADSSPYHWCCRPSNLLVLASCAAFLVAVVFILAAAQGLHSPAVSSSRFLRAIGAAAHERHGSAPLIGGEPALPVPGEALPPLVAEVVKLTGHPPLLSRADLLPGGPDFETKGALATTYFRIADPPPGGGDDSVYRYALRSEDTLRDVVLALLTSPGRVRAQRDKTDSPPGAVSLLPADAPSCKASPVTWRYWCRSSLLRARPELAGPLSRRGLPVGASGTDGSTGGVTDGVHDPTSIPTLPSTRLWAMDVGSTTSGYYGLLAASMGVPALLIDPQPQCGLWTRAAAAASGLSGGIATVLAVPVAPGSGGGDAFSSVPARSGCQGTSTIDKPPGSDLLAAQYGALAVNTVRVPFLSVDAIVAAEEAAAGHPPGSTSFLFVKVDAAGWEDGVLGGMEGLLASHRVAALVVEVNKQHLVRRLRAGTSAGGGELLMAGSPADVDTPTQGTAGYAPPATRAGQTPITPAENLVLAAHLARLARSMFSHGFQLLTADRGWFSAQDPFDASSDAARPGDVDAWAAKLMAHGEVDLFFYLPDSTRVGGGGGE